MAATTTTTSAAAIGGDLAAPNQQAIIPFEVEGNKNIQTTPLPEEFDLKRLNAIAETFNVVVGASVDAVRMRAFNAVFNACLDGRWSQIRAAQNIIQGITDIQGRCIYHVLVDEGHAIAVGGIARSNDLSTILSDGYYVPTLHGAAAQGAVQMMKNFADTAGIDGRLPSPNQYGFTPLFSAIETNCERSIAYLLRKGASDQIVCEYDGRLMPPLAFATALGFTQAFDTLVTNSRDPRITRQRIDATATKRELTSLLHIAIEYGQFHMLAHIRRNYTSAFQTMMETQPAPILLAAEMGDVRAVRILEEMGANVNAVNGQLNTPLHLAALGRHRRVVQLLAKLKANLNAKNAQRETAEGLLKNADDIEGREVYNILGNLDARQVGHIDRGEIDFGYEPPQNLAFRGGGPAGVAFFGLVQVLEERGLMASVRRVAGTSAGAIQACLIALGLSAQAAIEVMNDIPLEKLVDTDLGGMGYINQRIEQAERLEPILGKINGFWSGLGQVIMHPHQVYQAQRRFSEIYAALDAKQGLCPGNYFLEKLEEVIQIYIDPHRPEEARGTPLTFGDLRKLVNSNGNLFKHLHVWTTRLETQSPIKMSSEDPLWNDLIVAHAVRASMSIPLLFKPHVLHFRNEHGTAYPRSDLGHMVDGGLINNMPIETFDKRRYTRPGATGAAADEPEKNRCTLGIALCNAPVDQTALTAPSTVSELIKGLIGVYGSAEDLMREIKDANFKNRIVEIDRRGVQLTDFSISEEKKRELIRSGRLAGEEFFGELDLTTTAGFTIEGSNGAQIFVQLPAALPVAERIEREAVRDAMDEALLPPKGWKHEVATPIVALIGEDGVGKSEAAKLFCEENVDEFALIHWIDASSQMSYINSFRTLAEKILRMSIKEDETADSIIERVIQRLEDSTFDKPWCLVFDDMQVRLDIPQRAGHVLITARTDGALPEEITAVIPVNVFSREESIELILRRLRGFIKNECIEPEEFADRLANALGDHPQAIQAACAFLRASDYDPMTYVTELTEAQNAHTAIWEKTIAYLDTHHTDAANLLRLCAHLDPSGIPIDWLAINYKTNEITPAQAREEVRELLLLLRTFGVVAYRQQDGICSASSSIHRCLVSNQEFNRSGTFLLQILETIGETNPDNQDQLRQLQRHVIWLFTQEAVADQSRAVFKVKQRRALARILGPDVQLRRQPIAEVAPSGENEGEAPANRGYQFGDITRKAIRGIGSWFKKG